MPDEAGAKAPAPAKAAPISKRRPKKTPLFPKAPSAPRRSQETLLRIADMSAIGATIDVISARLGMSENQLRTLYGRELEALGHTGTASHIPTEKTRTQVKIMAAVGNARSAIAKVLAISVATLDLHYGHELEVGLTDVNSRVGANLIRMATMGGDSKTAAICGMFWMKTRAGFRETNVTELTGPDGQPIKTENQVLIMLPPNGRETPGTREPPAIDHDGC